MRNSIFLPLAMVLMPVLRAQSPPDPGGAMAEVLRRLDRLEKQNEELRNEVRELRTELGRRPEETPAAAVNTPETPSLADRVGVVESRVDEQAQIKVETGEKLPVKLTGMLLFNAFANSRAGEAAYGLVLDGPDRDGATLSQSVIGFRFNGPGLPGGGHVNGSLDLDFYGGRFRPDLTAQGYGLEVRRGVVSFDWDRRSVEVGQDKPLISQRGPDSLAQVAYPALAQDGNPWYWQPEVRYEERFRWGDNAGVNVAGAVLATAERAATQYGASDYGGLDAERPGVEGRVSVWKRWGEDGRVEIGPGFHASTTHVNGYSVPSRFASLDWLIQPARWVQFTGLVFGGENMANLGGFNDGFAVRDGDEPVAVRGVGGWSQLAFPITPRWTVNAFAGMQAPQTRNLTPGLVSHGYAYAGNVIYRLRSNVLLSGEVQQQRTGFTGQAHTIENHYDLAIGYLF